MEVCWSSNSQLRAKLICKEHSSKFFEGISRKLWQHDWHLITVTENNGRLRLGANPNPALQHSLWQIITKPVCSTAPRKPTTLARAMTNPFTQLSWVRSKNEPLSNRKDVCSVTIVQLNPREVVIVWLWQTSILSFQIIHAETHVVRFLFWKLNVNAGMETRQKYILDIKIFNKFSARANVLLQMWFSWL